MSVPPRLNRALVGTAALQRRDDVAVPAPELLELPEKAVQFGTGAFLRGFVEYFLDEANRRGLFGGRVVAVGSTGSGRDAMLGAQDGLFTLASRGVVDGRLEEEYRIVASLSRALSAAREWPEVLRLARSPELELVFSNTTEVGIALDEADRAVGEGAPRSYPAKLARFLLERSRAFDFDPQRGVVVIPCELIENNGDRLRALVLEQAERWGEGAEPRFREWIDRAVPFCNTLVDRIVPGAPGDAERAALLTRLGYEDELLTSCERYRLFAIEAAPAVAERLRFAAADPGIIVTDDVAPYRERKVRVLNGAHTLMVPVGLLMGCRTVREAMEHPAAGRYVRRVLLDEVVPGLGAEGGAAFAAEVMDRFRNPYIHHALLDIALQATMKMRVRVVPSILRYAGQRGHAPAGLAFGFAGFLAMMEGGMQRARRAAGMPVPVDDGGSRIAELWAEHAASGTAPVDRFVWAVARDASLWGADLTAVPGFCAAVTDHLWRIRAEGMRAALDHHLTAAVA